MPKIAEKAKAIQLRKEGRSYSEIMKVIPVAKSTLSLWLREVGLAKAQKQHITQKRLDAAMRGAQKRRAQRISSTELIKKEATREIGKLDSKLFWMVGSALYWAEGSKQKEHNVSARTQMTNSDPQMIRYFYEWLVRFCDVKSEDLICELYIHTNGDIVRAQEYWASVIPVKKEQFTRVRIKKGNIKSYRKNKGKDYYGVIRISVRRGTNLNRRIMAWAEETCRQFMIYSGVV
ncbi:MAG: hypothetical protein Q7S66_02845 [bacterium]|nr:hypothetical protein [bacterium]